MALSLKFRVNAHKTNLTGLKDASKILQRNLTSGLNAVGKRFYRSSTSRMRKDTGASQKSLQIKVGGKGLDLGVIVFADAIQAYIDAMGLPRGVFPPFGEGTPLYRWSRRRVKKIPVKKVKKEKVPKRTLFQLNKNWERRRRLRGVKSIRSVANVRASGNKRVRRVNNDTRRLTFLVARAIYRKGIKATHWNVKALEANKNVMVNEIANALRRAVVEMGRK
jgi:hypothetical protein